MRHSLDTGWWDNRSASTQWDKVKVPLYSAGNWSGHNLHLRGNVRHPEHRAYRRRPRVVSIAAGHSTFAPELLTTFAHFSVS